MDTEDQSFRLLAPSAEYLASVKVFPLIPALRKEVSETIDSPLSWDQLTASDINFSVVRPLVFKYARLKNMASVYACLVVRSYFLKESEENLAYSGVNFSRAMLCEILSMKLLSYFGNNYIQLVAVLTTSWNPLAGATLDVVEEVRLSIGGDADDVMNYPQSALEMAISSKAKDLISSPVSQRVVNDIYAGRVVFSMAATRSVLADNYKPRPIEIYDSRNSPFIDHYRLRVPKYGAILEFLNFALLLVTFVLCLSTHNLEMVTLWEGVFLVVAVAFTLEEYTAATEHGWIIYIANMWNVFDSSFILIFLCYLGFRIKGLAYGDTGASDMAFDILSCGACVLFPRLAFFAVSNTVVVLSLRAMISEFVFFIGIAMICFSGLLFTLWTLGQENWTLKAIAWLMVQIWFGNTYLSFGQASSFHPLFGPILMTMFAALSNTLLLTILISILSNTVARIDANATQEHLFQFAISTIEGVKSDALFSYQPPFNLVALCILKPASWVISPRQLHSLNVFLIKTTNFPILLVIGMYERYSTTMRESGKDAAHLVFNSLPRQIKNMPLVEALVGSTSADLYDAIFDIENTHEEDLFEGLDTDDVENFRPLSSLMSRDSIRSRRGHSPAAVDGRRPRSLAPPSPGRRRAMLDASGPNLADGGVSSAEVPRGLGSNLSPLARLFTSAPRESVESPPGSAGMIEASMKKMETLMDDIKGLPVHRLKDEMKELQERQARIENLLLMLTRGMRNEAPPSGSRHDTMKL